MSNPDGLRARSRTELVALADELADLMGAEWLEAHAARPYQNQHPIAAWLHQYRNSRPEMLQPPQQLLLIGELVSNIRELRNSGTQNVEARISDLRLDDEERVMSAIHEIRSAAEYVRAGRRVYFIPEAGEKTPDFLVDNSVEVECKRRAGANAKDRARFELYELLDRRLRNVFPEHISHSGLVVDVFFDVEPTRQLTDRIVDAARQGLRQTRPSSFTDALPGVFAARFEVLPTGPTPTMLMLPRGQTEFDYISTGGVVGEGDSLNRIIILSAACSVRQDRVQGTIRLIKKAARQFSGRLPSIVSLDISSLSTREETDTLAHLRGDIRDTLRNNTTISRVELSVTRLTGEPGTQIYETSVEMIDNPDALRPIQR